MQLFNESYSVQAAGSSKLAKKLSKIRKNLELQADDNRRRQAAGEKLKLDGKKILIVDDEVYNCEILKSMLLSLNPEFRDKLIICMSGIDALEKIRMSLRIRLGGQAETDIGIILTDLSMPRMDGYQLSVKCR